MQWNIKFSIVFRAETPEVFEDFYPTAADAPNQQAEMVLPRRDKQGRRILYSNLGQNCQSCVFLKSMVTKRINCFHLDHQLNRLG